MIEVHHTLQDGNLNPRTFTIESSRSFLLLALAKLPPCLIVQYLISNCSEINLASQESMRLILNLQKVTQMFHEDKPISWELRHICNLLAGIIIPSSQGMNLVN